MSATVHTGDYDLDRIIRKVPDFPKKGILFYDITSILLAPEAFQYCIRVMKELYQAKGIDAVAAVEARGFLFAAPFAHDMGLPLILIRKKGKLPGRTLERAFELEYGIDEIQVHAEDVPAGSHVLVVDDLVATGGTLRATCDMLCDGGAAHVEVFSVVGLPFLAYEKTLAGYDVTTLINYAHE